MTCAPCAKRSPAQQGSMALSLQDMLQEGSSDDEDFISEEDIQHFRANEGNVLRKRQELREMLRKRFDSLQHQRSPDRPSVDRVVQKMCNLWFAGHS